MYDQNVIHVARNNSNNSSSFIQDSVLVLSKLLEARNVVHLATPHHLMRQDENDDDGSSVASSFTLFHMRQVEASLSSNEKSSSKFEKLEESLRNSLQSWCNELE